MVVDKDDGYMTSRGWKGKKYYLSDEAVALLKAHCKGTPYSMSAALDLLIRQMLDPAHRRMQTLDPVAAAEIASLELALSEERANIAVVNRYLAEVKEALRVEREARAQHERELKKQKKKGFNIDV